ncbi:MAG: GNAT family N-acetyltransferase [Rhodoferax sp.]|uniref:GNAT family N-acetyltransferase n=1 Tax=Rhodoferax sp. TaxID=50421 RepID=UPI00261185D9|nr:GNAT family N-acetyltransferase [Rhodoferax sp.]MDD5333964.1 GNAT family N-acetyltransferase [Rhodoferax sp.]
MKSARVLEDAGQYRQAYSLLQRCDQLLAADGSEEVLRGIVKAGLWRLAPLWWAKLQHGGISLRRCQADDADFFQKCFADEQFCRQFNRQQPWRGKLALALEKSGKLPPIQTGLLMWVVQSSSRGPIGLASLSNIDTGNRRAELAIGFPGQILTSLGIKTTLMMLHFALVMMPLNKVYAYVYEDNPRALHNALRLGFVHEGKLSDHFNLAGQGFVSVNIIGLTRAQMACNANLKILAKRKIGQSW